MTTLETALGYLRAGLSVIPVRRDGSKTPCGAVLPEILNPDTGRAERSWKPFQERLPTEEEVRRWWDVPQPPGISVICGHVSGDLELLDFDAQADATYAAWSALVKEEVPDLLDRLSLVLTPNGRHIRYRCPDLPDGIPGNHKLALDPSAPRGQKVLIETRGEGGYALAPGCPPECHETGGTYRHVWGPPLTELQEITGPEREVLLRCARSLTREAKVEPHGQRPGDDYDRRGPDWAEILEPAGWRCVGRTGEEKRWRRPGKDRGWSATTGRCKGAAGEDLLHVFSSNADPFEDGKCYGKFRAWAILNYRGDLAAASRSLAQQGYGERTSSAPRHETNGHHAANATAAQPPPISSSGPPAAGEGLDVPLPDPVPWPRGPRPIVYHGLAGDIMRLVEPQTEADPVAILIQILVMFGSAIGRSAHWKVEEDLHYGNLFACLVGDSAIGRKGVSRGRAQRVFSALDDDWAQKRIVSGLSSGEGLIWKVRDPIRGLHQVKSKGRIVDTQDVVTDHGVSDKRLLVVETEFVRPLLAMQRKGNTLSPVLRQAWDCGNLHSATKNTPAQATGAHISLIGHITRTELRASLHETEAFNGFVNRFLWVAVKRSKLLPFGGDAVDLGHLAHKVALAIEEARWKQEIGFSSDARDLWAGESYERLNRPLEGVLGAVRARAAAQVRRLAMLYALLDFSDEVRLAHLLAALALWDYCEESCRWVFDMGTTGDRNADEILAALDAAKDRGGLTQEEIYRHVFHCHLPAMMIRQALVLLRDRGLVRENKVSTGGRPALRFARTACVGSVESVESRKTPDGASPYGN